MEFSDDKCYAGKMCIVEGTVEDNGEVLDVGGEIKITFSSGAPTAEAPTPTLCPCGRFSLVVPALKKGTNKKIWKKLKINKKGVITVKKGKLTKKLYKIKVRITAKGNDKYNPKVIIKTVRLKVK